MFFLIFISNNFHPAHNFKILNSAPIHNGLQLEKIIECKDPQETNCTILIRSQPEFITVLKNFKESAYGEIYLQAIEMYKENLIFGIGLNNYKEMCLTEKYNNLLDNIDCVTHPHNFYFEILAETGSVGLFIFLSFLFIVFKKIINTYKKNTSNNNIIISISLFFMFFWPIKTTGSIFSSWNSYFYIMALVIIFYQINFLNFKNK